MKTYGSQKGQALIITVGVLALMLIVAVTFASSMLMQRREAANFLISIKAGYIAESGINKAIADIRSRITLDTYSVLKNYISNYVSVLGTDVPFGGGIYDLAITYEEDKVNINTFDEEDDSQVAVLYNGGAGLPYQQIANIIDYRDYDTTAVTVFGSTGTENGTCKNQPYNSTEEIKAAFVSAGATQAQANAWYSLIKNSITINKPIIRGGLLGKYYSNITGTSPNVQIDKTSFKGEVVELGYIYAANNDNPLPGADGSLSGWSESHDAEFAGGHLVDSLGDFGLTTFAVVWEGYLDILPSDVGTPINFWVNVDDGARLFIDNSPNILPAAAWQDQGKDTQGFNKYSSSPYTFTTPGWHRIKIEYYDQTGQNTLMLRWKGATWDSATGIKPEEFGYEPPTESGVYNHAGNYKITCAAQILQASAVLTEKKVSSEIKVFGTWTQTLKEEFYAPWIGTYNDYRDGEVNNITWLDSCPTDTDYWDAGASRTHWEVAPATIPNSLKLGFWDNFDEDPAYSTAMMKGYKFISAGSPTPWWQGTLDISFNDVSDVDGDGDQELGIETNIFEVKYFELNRNYYSPTYVRTSVFVRALTEEVTGTVNVQGTPTNFIGPPSQRMSWRGSGAVSVNRKTAGDGRYYEDTDDNNVWNWSDSDSDGSWDPGEGESQVFPAYDTANPANQVYVHQVTPPGTESGPLDPNQEFDPNNPPAVYSYWQPEPPFCTAWLYPKAEADDDSGSGYFTLLRDRDSFLYTTPDQSEMNVYSGYFWNFPYSAKRVIATTGWDDVDIGAGAYYAFVNGQKGALTAPPPSGYPVNRIFRFKTMNRYDKWAEGAFESSNHLIRGIGASTKQYISWDNIRAMQKVGDLVSTQFNNGYNLQWPFVDNPRNIRWGRVTFTAQTPTNTSILLYLRQYPNKASIPTTSSQWGSPVANGASIGGYYPWLQYDIMLISNSFDGASYTNSTRTPVFEDITFTYIPIVEIFSWKNEL